MQEKWEDTGKVLDGNSVVTEWYRGGNEKESGKKQAEGRRKIWYSQVNNSVILRISYVYLTYMLRISYVIDSGKIGI